MRAFYGWLLKSIIRCILYENTIVVKWLAYYIINMYKGHMFLFLKFEYKHNNPFLVIQTEIKTVYWFIPILSLTVIHLVGLIIFNDAERYIFKIINDIKISE